MNEFVSLDDLNELSPMSIRTTQRTKTFYFRPIEGWKRGESEEVRLTEERIMKEMKMVLSTFPDVSFIRSSNRYFEFYFETEIVNIDEPKVKDFTDTLRACIGFLMVITRNENLTLVTVGV